MGRLSQGLGLGAALCLMGGDTAVAATRDATLNLSVRVMAHCSLSVTSALAFGAVQASSGAPGESAGDLSVSCSAGAPVYIMFDQGLHARPGSTDVAPMRRMASASGDSLEYQLYRDAARTTVWGNAPPTALQLTGQDTAVTVPVYGRVQSGQAVPAGAYTDTLSMVLAY